MELLYDLSDFYKVLGDSTRIRILVSLLESDKYVNDLVNELNMTPSAISHQLQILRNNDFVKNEKIGQNVKYSVKDEHIKIIIEYGLIHLKEKNIYEED